MVFSIPEIFVTMLVLARAGALFAAVPVIGGETVPGFTRVAVAGMTALMLAPNVPVAPLPSHYAGFILAMGLEFLIGVMMAVIVRAVFATIEFAGHIISMEIGLMQSQSVNPLAMISGSSVGVALYFMAIMIFLATELHHEAILAFARSFEVLPVGAYYLGQISVESMIEATSAIFRVGFLMSAPFIAVNFLILMVFALLGKVAPKMNVFMVSFAVRILAGFTILMTTATLLAHYIYREFLSMPGSLLDVLRGS